MVLVFKLTYFIRCDFCGEERVNGKYKETKSKQT